MRNIFVLFGLVLLIGCSKNDGSKNTPAAPQPDPVNMMTDIVGQYKGGATSLTVTTRKDVNGTRVDTTRSSAPGIQMTITRVDNVHFFINYQHLALEDTIRYQGLSYYQDNSLNGFVNNRSLIFTPDRDSLHYFSVLTFEISAANPFTETTRYQMYLDFRGKRN